MRIKKKGEKAVSPVITTVLLISIVIILAIIIFLWARSFIGEKISKFDKPIESVCDEVKLKASIDGTNLVLNNQGNVPVYAINIKKNSPGTSTIEEKIIELDKGGSKNENIGIISSEITSLSIIPVLLGEVEERKEKFTCPESVAVKIDLS